MLTAGQAAPEFTVPDASGETVRLSDFRGKNVVLFFYPRADTPGCTAEACAFRDAQHEFEAANTVILGISADDKPAQSKFASKYGLTFRLLSDVDHAVAEAYGAWVEKNNYGKKYMGIQRSTFVIGPDARLVRVFPKVSVEGHAAAVLQAVSGA
jgi:thioredoxin-dependent peroxiredoxin